MAMLCPKCACRHCPATNTYTRVVRHRGRDVRIVRRRRVCRYCEYVFYTHEKEEEEIMRPDSEDQTDLPNPFL